MVDYIRAEVYKVTHRKYLWGFLLIVGGLEALLVCMWAWMNGDMTNMSASTGFTMVLYLLTMGYYASAITTDMVFSDQYKFNTLKNEVAYGIPRARIYLGKLAVGCLVSLASCVVILLWYGLLCKVLLPGDGAWLEALKCVAGRPGALLHVLFPLEEQYCGQPHRRRRGGPDGTDHRAPGPGRESALPDGGGTAAAAA